MSSAALTLDRTEETLLIPAIADDGSLYPIGKMEAHRRGLLHLAISVFVFSGNELLIQRRAAGKYHSGGQWANTCCTHPHWGEEIDGAAARRMREELGIDVALTPTRTLTYDAKVSDSLVEHERVQVFRGDADKTRLAMILDPAEVAAIRWASPDALRVEAQARPHDFAPWFHVYLNRWDELGL